VLIAAMSAVKIEELEGDIIPTTDHFFVKIGEPVPLNSNDSNFDLQTPPSQPLTLSQRFRLTFVAHSQGNANALLCYELAFHFQLSIIAFKLFYVCF